MNNNRLSKNIHFIKADILDTDLKYILHQVNCKGVMGAGLAKKIKELYPNAYLEYVDKCQEKNFSNENLGDIQLVEVSPNKIICNLFGQDGYGKIGLFTNYEALTKCFEKINQVLKGEKIAIPYKIACGRAGGDWNIVLDIIYNKLINCQVYIFKINE